MIAEKIQPISFESLLLDDLSFYTTRFYGAELKDIRHYARGMHTAYNLCKRLNIPMIETERTVLRATPEALREKYFQDIAKTKVLVPEDCRILAEEFQIKTP